MATFDRFSKWLDLSYDPDGDDNFRCYKADDGIVMKNSGRNQVMKFRRLVHVLGRDLDNIKTADLRCIFYSGDWNDVRPEIRVNSKKAVDLLAKTRNENADFQCFALLFVNCG